MLPGVAAIDSHIKRRGWSGGSRWSCGGGAGCARRQHSYPHDRVSAGRPNRGRGWRSASSGRTTSSTTRGRASPLGSMVTPAQVLIIAGLPRAAALALVQAAQVPTQVGDSDDTVRHKLTIAVWAAETLRSPLDFRGGLRTSDRTPALDYLGVDATWAEPLQDAFLTSALTRCQRAP